MDKVQLHAHMLTFSLTSIRMRMAFTIEMGALYREGTQTAIGVGRVSPGGRNDAPRRRPLLQLEVLHNFDLWYELSRVRNRRAACILPMDFAPSELRKKIPTDVSDDAKQTSVFVSGRYDAEGLVGIPGPVIPMFGRRVGLTYRSRTPVGSAESPRRSSRSSPGTFEIQNVEIYLALLSRSQNDEIPNNLCISHYFDKMWNTNAILKLN